MRNVSDKIVQEIETHILYSVTSPKNRAVYKIMWKNTVEPDRPHMTIWRMRTACWITKATNTHSQYAILIAFPLQQLVHELTSLRYTYIVCLVLQIAQLAKCAIRYKPTAYLYMATAPIWGFRKYSIKKA